MAEGALMLSVVIPARNEPHLQKTIDSLLGSARGDIEVIAILDGYWPDPPIRDNPAIKQIHFSESRGMRTSSNAAARIAKGKYLMKVDAHCIFGEGFDEILKADCERDWLVVPRRYSLDAENWVKMDKAPIDYMYLSYPLVDGPYGTGLHGVPWREYEGRDGVKDKPIDDLMSFQGSCWMMHREKFFEIGCADAENYHFFQEAQELGLKIWLSGGRVIRNKKTWYAHLHKSRRGYPLGKNEKTDAERYSTDLWMNNKWVGQTRQMSWLIDKFAPVPGWPEDWEGAYGA